MILLDPSKYSLARGLFAAQEHHALVRALFANDLKANLFVDDESNPRCGLIPYNGRFTFGGEPRAEFNADLRHYFTATIFPARKGEPFAAMFSSDEWIPALKEIFNGHELILAPRLYFEAEPQPAYDISLPAGFSLREVTRELLDSSMDGLSTLREEMLSERTSLNDFLANSFGLCPVYENRIAGWCLSEYNTGDLCEIGIATLEPHQRRGIATALTHSFLMEAFKRGYRHVGWDCWERNVASAASARKAGFALKRCEQALVVIPAR